MDGFYQYSDAELGLETVARTPRQRTLSEGWDLERFVDDDEVVIAESCEVALDLLEWVASKRLDYSE